MSNIDEKTIAGILERIGTLKKELSQLESAILAIKLEPETASSDSGSLRSAPYPGKCSPEPDLTVSESPEAVPAVSPELPELPEPDLTVSESPESPESLESLESPEAVPDAAAEVVEPSELAPVGSTTASEEEAIDIAPEDDTPIDISISDVDDLPADIVEPKKAIMDVAKADTAVMDVMAEKQAWRTDRPGMPVKNIISAISLNDRVLLINTLFGENPILFQETIAKFNGMASLSEALTYISENHADWDMNSEPVYRLMMAVRRKLS